MIPVFGRLVPSDPPEKWKAAQAALESDDKTARMLALIKADGWMKIIYLLVLLLAAVVVVVLSLLL